MHGNVIQHRTIQKGENKQGSDNGKVIRYNIRENKSDNINASAKEEEGQI